MPSRSPKSRVRLVGDLPLLIATKSSVDSSINTRTDSNDNGSNGGMDGKESESRAVKFKKTVKNGLKTTRAVVWRQDDNTLTRRTSGDRLQTKVAMSDVEKLAQKSGTNTEHERFKVMPDYAYPNTKFNREELRKEMNKKSSYYHDLQQPPDTNTTNSTDNTTGAGTSIVGSYYLEILQCFGIPRPELLKETSAFCVAVCGKHAFKTDVMPPVANPMWLSKMRRACVFPLYQAYASVSIGVFAKSDYPNGKDGFIGRVVVDMARLRPGCTYDITLPLRQSSQVYSKEQRGAIRFRFQLEWQNERRALLSYLPTTRLPSFQPHESVTVRCCDNKAFQNVARVVHGTDMPGKFSMKLFKATIREVNFVRIHVLRYVRKRQMKDTMQWRYPLISMFVFLAWMHSVIYVGNIRYVPGHLVTYLLLIIWKNYALYAIDGKHDDGFSAPTVEEMMGGLLFSNERNRKNYIRPLEMERKDPDHVHSALAFFDEGEAQQKSSLQEIGIALRDGVKQTDKKSFAGTDAVEFLIDNGYAETRLEAVHIGNRLEKDLRLFAHVSRKYEFKDADLYYVFLNFDTSEYIFKTHRPWFKRWFRLLGFYNKTTTEAEAHWEMPFATGIDHPRFTIKESLVIRSKESRNLLQTMQAQEDLEVMDDFGVTDYERKNEASKQLSNIADLDVDPKPSFQKGRSSFASFASSSRSVAIEVELDQDDSDDDIGPFMSENVTAADIEVKLLPKPPNQDINYIKKDDRKMSDLMVESRHKMHGMMGHVFNDRAYKLSLIGDTGRRESRMFKSVSQKVLPKRSLFSRPGGSKKKASPLAKFDDPYKARQCALTSRKDEYDRLLHLSKYSHKSVIVSKIAVIIQPILEIVQLGLRVVRALFNIFTWRDPFYTFWVVIFGSMLVVLLHIFPWRVAFGVAGILFVGPQNWVLRVLRERKNGPESEDLDTIVRKRKPGRMEEKDDDIAYFSSFAPDNRPVRDEMLDTSDFKEVAVPHTPLNYRRFYDWPPQPDYARVWKSEPPANDRVADPIILEDDAFHLSDRSTRNTNDEGSLGWGNRAKRIVRGVTRVHKVPKQLRRRKKKLV
jgi:hypothetical protein